MATTKVSTKLLETVGVAEGGTGATSSGAARTSLGLGTVATLDTVSVATGGTGATSASAARTALGLVIGTNVLAPNGSAASLTNLPAGGASAAEATNIMLNAFRISVVGSLTKQNMIDGVVDEFEDETGVDTSTSTNETYDAASDFYGNAGGYTADRIPTMTSTTAPSGIVSASFTRSGFAPHKDWKAFDDVQGTSSGDNGWSNWNNGTSDWLKYEFSSSKVIAKYNLHASTGGSNQYHPKDWTFEGWTGSTWTVLDTQTNETSWGDAEVRTYTFSNSTSYISYRLNMTASNGSYLDIGEMEMMEAIAASNMTLFSNATTALAAPDDANIVIWQEDVDSVTLNTDLKAYASRNGGTTYTQMTLSEVASLTTGRILTGTVDISGQSSATAMKYKIETLNTKSQIIHAVALQWS